MVNGMKNRFMDNDWPKHGLERVIKCPVCGSNKRGLLYNNLKDHVFFCAPGSWSLYECKSCNCAYLDPRPTSETIHFAYSKYYTHTLPAKNDQKKMKLLRLIKRSMANGYRNWKYGTHLYPSTSFGVVTALIFPQMRQLLDQDCRNLPIPKSGACLLDVGFGNGAFLEIAKSAGWTVAGVDPDSISVESAMNRGLDVRHGGIEAYADMPESFDVVTMSHVIEHVHDPYTTLQLSYRLLKPGGFLWLSTPNIRSYGHEYYGRNWRGLEPPRHLVLFNWPAMVKLIQKAGFRSIQKFKYNHVFHDLAAKSEAQSKGGEHNASLNVTMRLRLMGILTGIRVLFQPNRTEYITLKAYKPDKFGCHNLFQ